VLKTKEGPLPSAPQVGHDEGNGGVEYGYRVDDEPGKQAVRSPEERREFREKKTYIRIKVYTQAGTKKSMTGQEQTIQIRSYCTSSDRQSWACCAEERKSGSFFLLLRRNANLDFQKRNCDLCTLNFSTQIYDWIWYDGTSSDRLL
jgi:hypothetical protein